MTLVLALLLACTGTDTDAPTETDDTQDTDDTEVVDVELQALTGGITWAMDFDAEAEAAGFVDCEYGRTYTAIEDTSAPWLCPDCDTMFRADVTMVDGWEACYQQIATDPEPQEWLGFGGGRFYRAPFPNTPNSDQGEATTDGETISTLNAPEPYELPDGGTFGFHIVGEFTVGEGTGDPQNGWVVDGASGCGWERHDPPEYTGDWTLAVGETVPDGWFLDQCEDVVRLHDFLGRYVVVDVSAMDCGPCQSMAASEPDFVADAEAAGIAVEVVTLLAPSLSAVLDPATQADLQTWVDAYDLHAPVLQDRGWGYAVVGAHQGEDFGYPSSVLVAPDGEVLSVHTGFGGWDDVLAAITAHAGR